MKKRNGFMIAGAAIVLLSLILEFAYYMAYINREDPIRQVSLIVYGADGSRFESLRQGAEMAAVDLNAEVTLITMSSEADALEQISLIQREIANGADALLIAACDSKALREYLTQDPPKIPYAFVETGITDCPDSMLTASDDQAMADALVRTIDENEKDWIKAAVIVDHTERESVAKRLDAVMNTDVRFAEEVVAWERNEQEKNKKAQFFLQRELTEEAVDVVIALDNSSMEELLDATVNLNKDIKIYGIANSAKSVYYLDNGLIKTLIYPDEFSIGYIALSDLLEGHNFDLTLSGTSGSRIRFAEISHENMYEKEYQRLLFPQMR